MKKIFRIFLLLGVLLSASNIYAQNMSDMRLNEVLVTNTDGYVDDFGNRSGWIELFNTSYGTVDVGGCFLTTDRNNLKMYMIPKADVLTKVKPRQHILFYADGITTRGTFHLGFTLDGAEEVLFVSSDGKTIIDEIKFPKLGENQSYGRVFDGKGRRNPIGIMSKSVNLAKEEKNQGTNGGWDIMPYPTPSTNNDLSNQFSKAISLKESDPYGVFLSLTAMSVVFLSLILLYIVFKNVGKFHIKKASDTAKIATAGSENDNSTATSGEVSAETFAAIAMAMHLFQIESEAHDYEDTILTINKVSKSYSPWSSKIYTLRETPQLRK